MLIEAVSNELTLDRQQAPALGQINNICVDLSLVGKRMQYVKESDDRIVFSWAPDIAHNGYDVYRLKVGIHVDGRHGG